AVRTSVLAGVGPAVLSTLATAQWISDGSLHEVQVEGLDLRRGLRAVLREPRVLPGPAGDPVNLATRARLPHYLPGHCAAAPGAGGPVRSALPVNPVRRSGSRSGAVRRHGPTAQRDRAARPAVTPRRAVPAREGTGRRRSPRSTSRP